jgi:uncharacterized protein involved in exopolysaccharide biosynthesis/Mrp family chromosome partitioning ATPase
MYSIAHRPGIVGAWGAGIRTLSNARALTEIYASKRDIQVAPAAMDFDAGRSDPTSSIADLWLIIWHGRRWILWTTAVLLLCVIAYGVLTPRLYTASAALIIDPRERQVVVNDVNPSTVASDGGIAQIDSQTLVIQSSGVLLRAIAALKLTQDPEFNGQGLLSNLLHMLGADAVGPEAAETRTLNALKRRLAVRRADKVFVVEVIVTAREADKAARIANAIADAYLADQAAAKEHAAQEASASLAARLNEQRQRVQQAEDKVQQFKTEKHIVSASGQFISEQQLTDLNTELAAARGRTVTLRAQVDQLAQLRKNGASTDATAEALQSAVVSKLREQEATLLQRASDLQSQLGPRHPETISMQQQLANIKQMISVELGRVVKSAQVDYERAQDNERRLSERLEQLKTSNLATGQDLVTLRELDRELEASRSVYAAYLVRANETREQAGIDSTNARIITRAAPPLEKSWPPMGLLLAAALGAGLGFGSVLALVAEYARPTLLTPAQAERVVDAPVIGVLPTGERKGDVADARFDASAWLVLQRLFDRDDAAAARGTVRTLVFVSSDADQGGSVAYRLAQAAARHGEDVLFIEAQGVSRGGATPAGLAEVLRGERTLWQVIRVAPGSDLKRMEMGRSNSPLPKTSGVAFVRRMLGDAQRQFDLLIVNAGALDDRTNLSGLVAVADDVVLVAKLAATRQSDLASLNETARLMGRPISAIVLADAAMQA